MYYLVGTSFILIVFWIGFQFVVSISSVAANMRSRFIYFSVPAAVCILSVIVGIFAGTVGPFGRDSTQIYYFNYRSILRTYLCNFF